MAKIEELVKTLVSIFEKHAADGEVIFTSHLTTVLIEGKFIFATLDLFS